MAEFKIKNEDLFHFARLNHKAVEEAGLVAFDRTDYLNIVKSGKTKYLVACGTSLDGALRDLEAQLSAPVQAQAVFLAIEANVDLTKGEEIDQTVDSILAATEAQAFFWNLYPTPEKGYTLHLLINRA